MVRNIFKRIMVDRKVRKELYPVEVNGGFAQLSPKGKLKEIIYNSSNGLKEWFYEIEVENTLPIEWDSFK